MPQPKAFSSADLGFEPVAKAQAQKPATNTFSSDDLGFASNAARPKTELGNSFIRGAIQGGTLGFGDEIAGAGMGLVGKLAGEGDFGPLYEKYRDSERIKNEAAQLDNPKAYMGGNLAGGIATSLIPGVGIAKGAGLLANVGKAALIGGTAGAGTSEANPLQSPDQLKEFGKDVAKGAVIGGVTQGAFGVAGKGLSALHPDELKRFANVKIVKAAGAMGGDMKRLGPEGVQQLGDELYQKGVVKAFDSLQDVAKKAASAKEDAGQAIGNALGAVDDLVTRAKSAIDQGTIGGSLPQAGKENLKAAVDKQFQFNMQRVGERIEKDLIAPNAKNPLLRGEMSKLQAIADDFKSVGSTTMKEGNIIKGTQGKVTNFNSDTVPQAFKREVYDVIKTELDDVVSKTGNLEAGLAQAEGKTIGAANTAARNETVSSAYQGAKKTYGAMKQAEEMATDRLGQTQANREISLTDYMAGGAALATGGAPMAIVAGGLNKLARQYGDSVMAVSARKAADIIERAPQALGKFAKILEEAARKGAPSLNATHVALMKEPDYRAILDNFEKTEAIRRRLGGTP